MKFKIFLIISMLILNICTISFAETFYIANNPGPGGEWTNGSNSNNGLSKSSPFLHIQYACSKMKSGDTLIIADGIYQGEDNMIGGRNGEIPEGSPDAYTIVRAENDGGVLIDGEGVRLPVLIRGDDTVGNAVGTSPSSDYIEIRGVVGCRGTSGVIQAWYVNHVKFINCGGYDSNDDNTMVFASGACTYLLWEGCYAWGSGRYKFDMGNTWHSIMRNCVARHDRMNGGPNGRNSRPMGGIVLYGSGNNEIQNCIVIDSDQSQYFIEYQQDQGCFGNPGTSTRHTSGPNIFTNCIALNNHLRFGTSDWKNYRNDVRYYNCIGYDHVLQPSKYFEPKPTGFYGSTGDSLFEKCFFGHVRTYNGQDIGSSGNNGHMYGYNGSGLGANSNITTNTIFYNIKDGHIFHQWEKSDYNNVFGLEEGKSVDRPGSDTYDSSTIKLMAYDPAQNGLKYLTRIEQNSTLETAGKNGNRVGAVAVKMYGKPGSMWGDAGYNKLQNGTDGQEDINLWPFPNEDIIQKHMKQYSYDGGKLTGARGFCSEGQTLTKYIWEYLGNPIPPEIYGKKKIAPMQPINVRIVQ